jgi:hypothetical protein
MGSDISSSGIGYLVTVDSGGGGFPENQSGLLTLPQDAYNMDNYDNDIMMI